MCVSADDACDFSLGKPRDLPHANDERAASELVYPFQVKLQSQPKVGPGETPLYTGAFDATKKVSAQNPLK